jgi:hypothetical protein
MTTESAYDHFRNAASEPVLRLSAVLFLDLLGTSHQRDEAAAQEHLRLTHRALGRARPAGGSEPDDQHISVASWFSDNLGLAYPVAGPVDIILALGLTINAAADHQLSLAYDGLFSRGGISCDGFYADRDFIYGPALNAAVALEHTTCQPRVALDESSVLLARHGLAAHEGGGEDATWRRSLVVDGDAVFVNYLDSLELFADQADRVRHVLGRHRDHIAANLGLYAAVPKIHEKYRWLAGYHDFFLSGFDDQSVVDDLYVKAAEPLGNFERFAADIEPTEPD